MRSAGRDPPAAAAYALVTHSEGLTLRRALLGGTFDPPHIGHLVVGQAAWEQLEVDVVTFLPAGDPWQKSDDRRITPAPVRSEMIETATDGIPYFEVDRRETLREGPTFTIDTIDSFESDACVLVVGADAAAGIPTWHRGAELAERVEIAVAARPGTVRTAVEAAIGPVRWLDMPELDVSSSELRTWIGRGSSGRFLVPDSVLDVIAAHRLYVAEAQY